LFSNNAQLLQIGTRGTIRESLDQMKSNKRND